jgi:hypothetical protein
VQVTIPGYFTSQPKIIVSPANIKLYDAAYSNQSQSIQCEAQNISESSAGSMVWRFTPKATLSLAANTGQTVINETSGSTSGGWTSSQYTTAANTSAVTLNVTLRSYRGTGTSGNYYYRTVRWKAQYYNGGWVDSAWSTSNLGADTAANVTTAITVNFPSAGAWLVRIVTEAYDTGGTFNTGTSYEYATDNLSRTDYQSITVNSPPQTTLTLNYSPSYSLPSGWEQTGQSITYTFSYEIINTPPYASASISGPALGFLAAGSGTNLTRTYTSNLTLSFSATAGVGSFNSGSYAKLELKSLTGTVSRRRALTNSSTAVNSFSLNYYNFSLSSSQVLAEGSLNWVALGE